MVRHSDFLGDFDEENNKSNGVSYLYSFTKRLIISFFVRLEY
jgi:hypothetical protein